MKKEPVLVIMAAGMGSRFGGLKQIEPVTDKGELIIEESFEVVLVFFFYNKDGLFKSCHHCTIQ